MTIDTILAKVEQLRAARETLDIDDQFEQLNKAVFTGKGLSRYKFLECREKRDAKFVVTAANLAPELCAAVEVLVANLKRAEDALAVVMDADSSHDSPTWDAADQSLAANAAAMADFESKFGGGK